MEKKLNNMLSFSDFENNWKPEESRKTKRTEVGLDIVKEGVKKTEKTFNTQHNIGKSKYVVNFHDGVKTHKDGSPFFDMKIFKNKEKMNDFIKELKKKGYSEK